MIILLGAILICGLLSSSPVNAAGPVVAIHVSESTQRNWESLPGPHREWQYWHIYGFLMESLRSDGTPFVAVSDEQIAAGKLQTNAEPAYPLLISLASTCVSKKVAARITQFAKSGGHVLVGSTAFTHDEQGQLCDLSTGSAAALYEAIGVTPATPRLISVAQKKVDASLVSHIKSTEVIRWLLPRRSTSIGYSHPVHWAQTVSKDTARVLLESGEHPLLTTRNFHAGRFVYHADFCPLAGFSGYVVDNLVYGVYRKVIEDAFDATHTPLVRLAAWPFPHVAAFKTRHDHHLHRKAALIEQQHGIRGEWLLRTNDSIGGPDWEHVAEIKKSGALIGSHTLNEYTLDSGTYETALQNVEQSFADLEAKLGKSPRIFVGPGCMANLTSSVKALEAAGVLTTGDMSHGPYPSFALYINTAESYDEQARSPLLEIPLSRYPAVPGAVWRDLIYVHMDSMPLPVILATVDMTYDLGGLINIYDHIGDPNAGLHDVWKYPTTKHLEAYLKHGLAKPNVWKTDPLRLLAWWKKRDPLRLQTALQTNAAGELTLTASVAGTIPAGCAIDVRIPPGYEPVSPAANERTGATIKFPVANNSPTVLRLKATPKGD